MSTVKAGYATSTAFGTTSLASLTSGQGRRGPSVDNSTNLYVDALVTFGVKIGTFTAPASYQIGVYASADGGTNFETGGNTDAAWNTLRGDEKWNAQAACYTNTTVFWIVGTVAWKYGGVMPQFWGPLFTQTNCGTLSATESDHTKKYMGFAPTVA